MRPISLHEVIERTRFDPDWDRHLRNFLDAFSLADGDLTRQTESIVGAPALLAWSEVDAFVGGVGEHLARRRSLPIPGWVRDDARYLARACAGTSLAPAPWRSEAA